MHYINVALLKSCVNWAQSTLTSLRRPAQINNKRGIYMKHLAMLVCILISPLSFASYHSGEGSSGGSSGGGGYGGSSGNAAALIAVGAVIFYLRRDNGESEESTEFGYIKRSNESRFNISFGDKNNFDNNFANYSNQFDEKSNNFQVNLSYNFY